MEEVDSATLDILAENSIMELLKDTEIVKYQGQPPNLITAEHGFSIFLKISHAGETYGILIDTGKTKTGVISNMTALGISIKDISKIVLSHGHYDHTGGLLDIVEKMGGADIFVHPSAFEKRYIIRDGKPKYNVSAKIKPYSIEKAGGRLIISKKPQKIAPGVLLSGEIKRNHEFEQPLDFLIKSNGEFLHDSITDDQSVIVNLKDKGILIITGCGHSGIINTIEHAIDVSGVKDVYGIIGGFHLIGADPNRIERTIQYLDALNPQILVPLHCTGFPAQAALYGHFNTKYQYASAGCKLLF